METERKTGLGGSLLLQRTEIPARVMPPAVPIQPPNTEMTALPEPPHPVAVIQSAPRTSRKRKKPALVLRDRCTLYLERDVNEQLAHTSHAEGRDRSEVVSELLRKHLPKYQIERLK